MRKLLLTILFGFTFVSCTQTKQRSEVISSRGIQKIENLKYDMCSKSFCARVTSERAQQSMITGQIHFGLSHLQIMSNDGNESLYTFREGYIDFENQYIVLTESADKNGPRSMYVNIFSDLIKKL